MEKIAVFATVFSFFMSYSIIRLRRARIKQK